MSKRRVRVELTEADIFEGCHSHDGSSCPNYLAVSRALNEPRVHVEALAVRMWADEPESVKYIPLPAKARKWIKAFDSGEVRHADLKPITYTLLVDRA